VTAVSVDRIAVRVPGLNPEEARRLQALLAGGLASARPGRPAAPPGAAAEPVDELARRILDALLSDLARRI
jgi:hypothetical protein